MISVALDGQDGIDAALRRLNTLAGDLDPEREVATKFLTEQIDDNFQNAENLFAPLAESTKKSRRAKVARGATLVANENTPLRAFGDSIRKAATAVTEDVIGSAYKEGDDFTIIGVDEEATTYMKRVLLGDDKKPERNATELQDSEIDEAQRLMEDSLLQRLNGVI